MGDLNANFTKKVKKSLSLMELTHNIEATRTAMVKGRILKDSKPDNAFGIGFKRKTQASV